MSDLRETFIEELKDIYDRCEEGDRIEGDAGEEGRAGKADRD